jgi:hypothetical protein
MHNKTKTAWLIFLTLFCISNIKAQTKAKDIVLNLGAYSGYGHQQREPFTENSGIPAMSVGAEYFFSKCFAIGTYVTYTYVYDKFVGTTERYKDVWRGWDIGVKPTFHFNPLLAEHIANKMDIYVSGFGGYAYRALRYDKTNIYRDSLNYSIDGLSAGGIIGFRFYASKKFGLYGELGKSNRWFIGGGVTLKLR